MSNKTHQPDHQPSNNNIDHNNPSILPYPSDETTADNRPYRQSNQTKQPSYTFEDYQRLSTKLHLLFIIKNKQYKNVDIDTH